MVSYKHRIQVQMEAKKVKNLIVKYITDSISGGELDVLETELEKPFHKRLFNDLVQINYIIDRKMKTFDTEKSKKLLLDKIRKDKGVRKKLNFGNFLKYAAIIVFSIGIGYVTNEMVSDEISNKELIPNGNFITLELEDGNIKVISENGSSEVRNSEGNVIGSQVGNQLVYKDVNKKHTEEPVYNTLKVPYGKHFELRLSDGSVAYLNAGSSLRYPVEFIDGKERTVFLTGEAFLEVAKDLERPFIVKADDLNIKVFGTKFNVSAYPEDKEKEIVLVEGSVGLYSSIGRSDNSEGTILTPGTKGSYDNVQGNITTEPVVTSIYTSWVQGVLVFRNMTFENILKKLERHYDLKIINKNPKLASVKFNASFEDIPIDKILEYFKRAHDFDFYFFDEHQIIVN